MESTSFLVYRSIPMNLFQIMHKSNLSFQTVFTTKNRPKGRKVEIIVIRKLVFLRQGCRALCILHSSKFTNSVPQYIVS